MDTKSMRSKLQQFVSTLDDERVVAIYTLFQNEIDPVEMDDDFRRELENRIANYYNGARTVSAEELRKRLEYLRNRRA